MSNNPSPITGNGDPPSQGTFIGYLGLVLAIFALAVGALAIITGAMHGFG